MRRRGDEGPKSGSGRRWTGTRFGTPAQWSIGSSPDSALAAVLSRAVEITVAVVEAYRNCCLHREGIVHKQESNV